MAVESRTEAGQRRAAGGTTRQLPLASYVAVLMSGVVAVVGNVMLYLSFWSVGQVMREDGEEGADAWVRDALARSLIGIALSIIITVLGVFLVRRRWSSAPRRDFAVVLAILATLVVGPAFWFATGTVAEIVVPY